jgi:predicted nucleic-acid-binding protein
MNTPVVAPAADLNGGVETKTLPTQDQLPSVQHATYTSLVHADEDMIGHVAYALYKRDKLKFCDSIVAKHRRPASSTEVDAFIHTSNLPTRVDAYRAEAEQLLERFSEAMLDFTLSKLQQEIDRELIRQLKEAKSMPRAITENLIANMLAIAITALFVLIIYASRIGLIPLIADVFGYDVKEKTTMTQSQGN